MTHAPRAFTSVSTWQQPEPEHSHPRRNADLQRIAARLSSQRGDRLRVAVDGFTGAGKTTFADELAAAFRRAGRSTARASLDDFKHPWSHSREHGYDRLSGQGYYRNAYSLTDAQELLLGPAGHDGSGCVALCAHDPLTGIDHRHDRVQLLDDTVLIVDSAFAARPELAGFWDAHIWLAVPPELALDRGVQRDTPREGQDQALRLHRDRYGAATAQYLSEVDARSTADLVVDNSDLDRAEVLVDRLQPSQNH